MAMISQNTDIKGINHMQKQVCYRVIQKKGLSFMSYRQRRKEGTFGASELAGIEPTPPAPEEQDMSPPSPSNSNIMDENLGHEIIENVYDITGNTSRK
jgi:hypothetical protein